MRYLLSVCVSVDSPALTVVLLWMFSFDSTFLSQLCVDILKTCRAGYRGKAKIFLTKCQTELSSHRLNHKSASAGFFTWTWARGVVGELLSWEQEHDLQWRDRQQRALVWEVQEVETCEGNIIFCVYIQYMFIMWFPVSEMLIQLQNLVLMHFHLCTSLSVLSHVIIFGWWQYVQLYHSSAFWVFIYYYNQEKN